MRLMKLMGYILIIGGVVVLIAAAIMHYSAEKKSSELVEAYINYAENFTVTEYEAEITSEDQLIQLTTEAEAFDMAENVMGVIIIDKIDLKAPLVEGTDNKSIRYALGHFKDTAMPGQTGNFAVAGHRSYTFGEYFNRLDELAAGDTVQVMYNGGVYSYIVDENYVVEPEQLEVLDSTDNATITLVTCTPKWTATHRLIVKGHLLEENNE